MRSDSSENGGHLLAPREAGRLPNDRSPTIQDDNGGRPHDTELPNKIQMGLGIDVDVGHVVQP